MDLCTAADVYNKLPPGSIRPVGRLVDSVSVAANTLTLADHGLADDDPVTLRADAGGAMPGGLSAGTTYYAIVVDDATFGLSAAVGGAAINITTTGTNVILVRPVPMAKWIEDASAIVEQTVLAHVHPITGTVPVVIADYAASLAAQRALIWVGGATVDIERMILQTQKLAEQWAKGRPVLGAATLTSANRTTSVSIATADPRGWVRGGDNTRIP
jgi:hypothetical protein